MPLPISQSKAQLAGYAGLLLGVSFGLWVIVGLGGPDTARIVSDTAFVLFAVFAGGCAIAAARASRGRERTAWTFVTVGIAGWLFADVVKSFLPLVTGEAVPFPSIADVGYLALPVATCLALVLMPLGHSGFSAARLLIDGVIVAGSLFLISWILVLRDLFAAGAAGMFPFAVVLAYPILDLVVITVGILVLIRARGPARAPVALLLAGIVLMAVSNDVYFKMAASSDYARGDLLDIGWAASMLMFALAALARFKVPQADLRAPEVSPWLPYLTLALAGVVSVGDLFNPASAIVLVLALGMVIAVLFRQFLVVGENQRLLAIVADQALRDPLTGVANRFLFHDRLTHAVAVHRRGAGPLALLSLDLDDFKLVNDALGHPAGDALLMQVADRIITSVRAGDTVARLGGDEFAILIEQGPDRPELVAQRVVEAFDEPFVVDGHVLSVRPSVGLSIAPADAPDLCADTLLKQSDAAMYAAKRTRTCEVHTFAPDMRHPDELELQRQRNAASGSGGFGIRILSELRRAIEHGDLELAYQPQIHLGTSEIVGVEALVRWPHPDRGLLEPASFLPMVRRNGLMQALTELVLDKALGDAAQWHAHGSSVPVAVNLFAPTLADVDLPRRIGDVLSRHGLESSSLTVEITEDLVLQDFQRTRMVLQQLRNCGTRVSIDDFGSGYSGLNYLRELPIDEVKLDREFIAPILDDARAASIVRAVIDLAHGLQVTCVAEGVESAEIANRLREFGCEVAQGFHYSPAVTAPVLFGMLSSPTSLVAGQQ